MNSWSDFDQEYEVLFRTRSNTLFSPFFECHLAPPLDHHGRHQEHAPHYRHDRPRPAVVPSTHLPKPQRTHFGRRPRPKPPFVPTQAPISSRNRRGS